jgi:hypothetical protein
MPVAFSLNAASVQSAVFGPVGLLLRGRLYDPTDATVIDLALVEGPAGTYSGSVPLASPVNNGSVAYTYEVRVVTAQTTGAFNASTHEIITQEQYGYLINSAWWNDPISIAGGLTTPPPGTAWGKMITLGQGGSPEAGVTVKIALTALPPGIPTGYTLPDDFESYVSDGSGGLAVLLPLGAVGKVMTSGGVSVPFTVPMTGTSFEISTVLGDYEA